MVGDDKGRENLGDYGDFRGIFFDFFAFVDFLWGIFGSTRSTRSVGKMVGTGVWWGLALASFSECSECSECSGDKKVWGVGVGIFCWWFRFFL